MKKLCIILVLSIFCASTAAAQSSRSRAECGDVYIVKMTWQSGQIFAETIKIFLENLYGCKVLFLDIDTVETVSYLNDRHRLDIIPELWLKSAPGFRQLEKEKKLFLLNSPYQDDIAEGWWVLDKATSHREGFSKIKTILENPELVDNVFHNCPSTWGCSQINKQLAEILDFEGHGIKIIDHPDEASLTRSIDEAFLHNKPWFGYYWTPTAVFAKYMMTRVSLGETKPSEFRRYLNDTDSDRPMVLSEFPTPHVRLAISPEFKKSPSNRQIIDILKKIQFSTRQMMETLSWRKTHNRTAEDAAKWLLKRNIFIFANWIEPKYLPQLRQAVEVS